MGVYKKKLYAVYVYNLQIYVFFSVSKRRTLAPPIWQVEVSYMRLQIANWQLMHCWSWCRVAGRWGCRGLSTEYKVCLCNQRRRWQPFNTWTKYIYMYIKYLSRAKSVGRRLGPPRILLSKWFRCKMLPTLSHSYNSFLFIPLERLCIPMTSCHAALPGVCCLGCHISVMLVFFIGLSCFGCPIMAFLSWPSYLPWFFKLLSYIGVLSQLYWHSFHECVQAVSSWLSCYGGLAL